MSAVRIYVDYLRDMAESCNIALEFVADMTYAEFADDTKTQFAAVRVLEIVGEATKQIPGELRTQHPDVP